MILGIVSVKVKKGKIDFQSTLNKLTDMLWDVKARSSQVNEYEPVWTDCNIV